MGNNITDTVGDAKVDKNAVKRKCIEYIDIERIIFTRQNFWENSADEKFDHYEYEKRQPVKQYPVLNPTDNWRKEMIQMHHSESGVLELMHPVHFESHFIVM